MEKLMIYPYGYEFAPLIRNEKLFLNFEITELVAPVGFALNNKDAGIADHGSIVNKIVESDFDSHIDSCDTLLIVDCDVVNEFKLIIFENAIKAISKGKNVICTLKLKQEQIEELDRLATINKVYFKYYGEYPRYDIRVLDDNPNALMELETPVVFVIGETENSNKFEIQLALRKELIELGYKVSQIGSRCYCELINFHSFPKFMIGKDLNESEKIILFNRLLKKIEKEESPDIIIVGIPGGIMPFNKKFTNKFGILSFEVSQAVSPDFVILSTLYNDIEIKYFDKINNLTKYRFGYEIDCFNFSNTQFDMNTSQESKKNCYNFLDPEFVYDEKLKYQHSKKPIYHIFNEVDRSSMVKFLIETLSSYSFSEIANLGGI